MQFSFWLLRFDLVQQSLSCPLMAWLKVYHYLHQTIHFIQNLHQTIHFIQNCHLYIFQASKIFFLYFLIVNFQLIVVFFSKLLFLRHLIIRLNLREDYSKIFKGLMVLYIIFVPKYHDFDSNLLFYQEFLFDFWINQICRWFLVQFSKIQFL